MMPARSQRNLNLKVSEEPGKIQDSFKETLHGCPYCTAPMPVKAVVCKVCRRMLPDVVIFRAKIFCCLVGALTFFVLTLERFYRLRIGDILWIQFDPSSLKYLEWLIADPGPFILGILFCGYMMRHFNYRLSDDHLIRKEPG